MEFLRALFQDYHSRKSNVVLGNHKKENVYKEFVALEQEISNSSIVENFWHEYMGRFPFKNINKSILALEDSSVLDIPRIDRYITISWSLFELLCKQVLKVSYKSVFLSVFVDMFAKFSSMNTLTIGVIANGRSERLTDPLSSIGLFWNIVPFNAIIQSNKSEQIKLYNQTLLEIEPYTLYPLAKLERYYGDSLFTATFNFLNFHNSIELKKEALKIQEIKFWDRFSFPLNFIITLNPTEEKNNVYIRIEYDANYFSRPKMEKFVEEYVDNLQAIIKEFSLI